MQVIQDEFFCMTESFADIGSPTFSAASGSPATSTSAPAAQVCQPGTEADDEPFADVEGSEKDELYPFDGGADGVNNTYPW